MHISPRSRNVRWQPQAKRPLNAGFQLAEKKVAVNQMELPWCFGGERKRGDEIQADFVRPAQGIFGQQIGKAAATGRGRLK